MERENDKEIVHLNEQNKCGDCEYFRDSVIGYGRLSHCYGDKQRFMVIESQRGECKLMRSPRFGIGTISIYEFACSHFATAEQIDLCNPCG